MSSNDAQAWVNQCLIEEDGQPCAIISDIHSNLVALEAVLADIGRQGVKRLCCLGDIVGYGPQPLECWRLVTQRCKVVIRGNHDQALSMRGIGRFHPRARTAVEWAVEIIGKEPNGEAIIKAISELPTYFTCRDRLYVHGSPAGVTMDYLLPRDSFDAERMQREFSKVKLCAFNGHSHIPGVIAKGSHFLTPEQLDDYSFKIGHTPAIINVGSVGQPRDGNPKSCYVIVDGDVVRYRRVAYDTRHVCGQILSIPQLDPFLGYRLLEGR